MGGLLRNPWRVFPAPAKPSSYALARKRLRVAARPRTHARPRMLRTPLVTRSCAFRAPQSCTSRFYGVGVGESRLQRQLQRLRTSISLMLVHEPLLKRAAGMLLHSRPTLLDSVRSPLGQKPPGQRLSMFLSYRDCRSLVFESSAELEETALFRNSLRQVLVTR